METNMNSPFPFDSMLVFAFLSFLLLVGVALRAKVGLLQKFLFPSCLVGGVLGLAIIHTGVLDIKASAIETFAHHFFNISFISVGLTRDDDNVNPISGKQRLKGPTWMALMQGLTFPTQAAVGGIFAPWLRPRAGRFKWIVEAVNRCAPEIQKFSDEQMLAAGRSLAQDLRQKGCPH